MRTGWLVGPLGLVMAALATGLSAGPELRRFGTDSYQAVLEAHASEPFLLVFWSLECPPCYRELKKLGEMGAGKAFETVLVATDGPGHAPRIRETLKRFDLQQAEWSVFDGPRMKLRFSVDRQWYGELPRSYRFDADHRRRTFTGVLQPKEVAPLLGEPASR